MFPNRLYPFLLILLGLFGACKKETKGGGSGIFLDQHLQLSVDSLCVQAPNVFTPNGDGMNDIFVVQSRNATAFSLTIRNESDSVVFISSNWNHGWNGIDTTVNGSAPTTGRYHCSVSVTGTSRAQLSGDYAIYVVPDPSAPCFNPVTAPVFGDQFDPRLCGPAYPSHDVVCIW